MCPLCLCSGIYGSCLKYCSSERLEYGGTLAWECRVVKAVDEALQLSPSAEAPITEVGAVIVHFLFALVAQLAEAVFEDWKMIRGPIHGQMMSLGADGHEDNYEKNLEQLKKNNSLAAVHLMARLMHNKRTVGLLRLARRNLCVSDPKL